MRTITGLLLTSFMAVFSSTQSRAADLLAYDGFAYPLTPNMDFYNGGTGWTSVWRDINALPTGVGAPGLAWPTLPTIGGCATTAPYQNSSYTQYTRAFGPVSEKNIYVSFLMRPNVGFGTGGGLSFGNYPNAMIVGAFPGSYLYGLMKAEGLGDVSNAPVVQGQTAFLVVHVQPNGAGATTWSLHVNPVPGEPEPAFPDAQTAGFAMPQALAIFNDGGFSTDEIRIGRTWGSVTPMTCFGDIDQSSAVNIDDLTRVILSWGPCGAACAADIAPPGGDGTVDIQDLTTVILNWGACGE